MSALAKMPEEILLGTSETALTLPDGLSEAEWSAVGETLGRAHRASAWWIGDWINYADSKWGERYDAAVAITGLSYGYLRDCASVSRRFSLSDRSDKLTWTHHYKARALADAGKWLARAEVEEWSVRELQEKTATATPRRDRVMPTRRHSALVDAASSLVRVGERWERQMTDALTPPQARKQLTVLHKAAERLAEVIEAVEYRAATPHQFMGR